MYCKHCGSKLNENADVCTTCGKFVDRFPDAQAKNHTISQKQPYTVLSVLCLIFSVIFCAVNIIAIVLMIADNYSLYVSGQLWEDKLGTYSYYNGKTFMGVISAFFLSGVAQIASVSVASSFLKSKFNVKINATTLIVAAFHFLVSVGVSIITCCF